MKISRNKIGSRKGLASTFQICICIILVWLVFINSQTPSKIKELRNVHWFDGDKFNTGSIYIDGEEFRLDRPDKIGEVIDLAGKYIIPPFGEAHTHNLASAYELDKVIQDYIDEGTLYVQVLGGSHKGRLAADQLIKESGLEVSYANGGITCTLGHPFTIYEPLAMGIHNPVEKVKKANEIRDSRLAENDAYWFFDTKKDVDSKWSDLMSTQPDLIKIMLLDAENYDSLYYDKTKTGSKGLSPSVAKYVVKKAEKEGLRVYAHVETASDFEIAVDIGVNVIAHIPGYRWKGDAEGRGKFWPKKETIEKAAKKDVTVITTASLSTVYLREYKDGKAYIDGEKLRSVVAYQKELIHYFKSNGIKVAFGSDQYNQTLFKEVNYLHDYGIVDNKSIIKTICEVNSKLIFPSRRIGEIRDGYQANFLILNGNPLEDFNNLKAVEFVYKKGERLK